MFIVSVLSKPFLSREKLDKIRAIPGLPWKPALNPKFADMTEEQIKASLMPANRIVANSFRLKNQAPQRPLGEIPDSFDSETMWPGSVGPVRDQASCGSCWSFSAIGDFGSRYYIAGKTDKFIQFSEQYPVSCDTKDMGCQGGSLLYVHQFLKKTGVPTDECVSYKSGDGNAPACPTVCDDGSEIKLTKSASFKIAASVDDMYTMLQTGGPIQGEFFVFEDFMYYESGVYQHETGKMLGGHGILIVGWGVDETTGTPYWRIRNSWGPEWGEAGYFRILRGTNECIIETAAAAALF